MSLNSATKSSQEDTSTTLARGTRRFFDKDRCRLIDVHCDPAAAQSFWDRHWDRVAGNRHLAAIHSPNSMVMRVTKRYLEPGAQILEGGCGLGQNVWGLERMGYSAWGVDNAKQTLDVVRELEPQLKLSYGDVRALDFPDATFDGYWSLGVIEHFWSGYDQILTDMARVLKPGGYLFITFPAMNPARTARASRGCYPKWDNETESRLVQQFYQYLLPVKAVEKDLQARGFLTKEMRYLDGYKGAKDEHPLINRISNFARVIGLARYWQKFMNVFASKRYGHIALLVMRKK
jgi:ubiquinone/menaquinone biosynthesis C-methylase UbiE